MPRRPPAPVDPVRRLAHVHLDGSGSTGKIWKGEIYVRGMEAELPADFPDDGPWWEDWIPDSNAAAQKGRGLAAHLARVAAEEEREARRRANEEAEALGDAGGDGQIDGEELEDGGLVFENGLGEIDPDLPPRTSLPPIAQPMADNAGARRAKKRGSAAAR